MNGLLEEHGLPARFRQLLARCPRVKTGLRRTQTNVKMLSSPASIMLLYNPLDQLILRNLGDVAEPLAVRDAKRFVSCLHSEL